MHNQVVIINLFQNLNGNNNNNANNANAAFVNNNNNVINNRRGSKSGDELFGQGTSRFNQLAVKIVCDISISFWSHGVNSKEIFTVPVKCII